MTRAAMVSRAESQRERERERERVRARDRERRCGEEAKQEPSAAGYCGHKVGILFHGGPEPSLSPVAVAAHRRALPQLPSPRLSSARFLSPGSSEIRVYLCGRRSWVYDITIPYRVTRTPIKPQPSELLRFSIVSAYNVYISIYSHMYSKHRGRAA